MTCHVIRFMGRNYIEIDCKVFWLAAIPFVLAACALLYVVVKVYQPPLGRFCVGHRGLAIEHKCRDIYNYETGKWEENKSLKE